MGPSLLLAPAADLSATGDALLELCKRTMGSYAVPAGLEAVLDAGVTRAYGNCFSTLLAPVAVQTLLNAGAPSVRQLRLQLDRSLRAIDGPALVTAFR